MEHKHFPTPAKRQRHRVRHERILRVRRRGSRSDPAFQTTPDNAVEVNVEDVYTAGGNNAHVRFNVGSAMAALLNAVGDGNRFIIATPPSRSRPRCRPRSNRRYGSGHRDGDPYRHAALRRRPGRHRRYGRCNRVGVPHRHTAGAARPNRPCCHWINRRRHRDRHPHRDAARPAPDVNLAATGSTGAVTGRATLRVAGPGPVVTLGRIPTLAVEHAALIWTDVPAAADWSPLTADAERMVISRGRATELEEYQVGLLEVGLRNTGGAYWPTATGAPRSGDQLRIMASYAGVDYPLAHGVIEAWDPFVQADRVARVQVIAPDLTRQIGQASITVAAGFPEQRTDHRLTAIADAWDTPRGAATFANGQENIAEETDVDEANARDLIRQVQAVEFGLTYVAKDGTLTMEARNAVPSAPIVHAWAGAVADILAAARRPRPAGGEPGQRHAGGECQPAGRHRHRQSGPLWGSLG